MKFTGKIRESDLGLEFDSPRMFQAAKAHLKGKRFEMTLGPVKKSRSRPQENYLYSCFRRIADFTGENVEAVKHHVLVARFGMKWSEKLGVDVPYRASMTELTQDEARELVDWLPPFALEQLGLQLPLPNEDLILEG